MALFCLYLVPANAPGQQPRKKLGQGKTSGEEEVRGTSDDIKPDLISFAQLKADPEKYVGKPFRLIGVAEVSDYFN